MNLEAKIEAILYFKNEPMTLKELSKTLKVPLENVQIAINKLQEEYRERGIVIVTNGEEVCFGTNKEESDLIETMQKDEVSKDIGRAGLETLALILYKGPIARREIDHIRGVNSTYILRNLMVRGLVEREGGEGRGYAYQATLDLFKHLGITKREDLPDFGTAFNQLEKFVEENDENA